MLYDCRSEWHETREQGTDKGSSSLPIVTTLAAVRLWGCGCGLYTCTGGELYEMASFCGLALM